jgi:hypothetical protein
MPAPKSEEELLERLNRLSVTRSFTPQVDVRWDAPTTEGEFAALYPVWSLLAGSGLDEGLDEASRATFAKYQQMNLMLFTALLERHAIHALADLYDLDPSQPFSEYVGHFLKEEIYHHMLFMRAIDALLETTPRCEPLPRPGVDRALRWLFRFTSILPSRRLRSTMTFTILRFAEQVTIYAHQAVEQHIPRKESLVAQVWAFHAMDEARHLAFDTMILERNRLPGPLAWIPRVMAAPYCMLLSWMLNSNEVWAARKLGVRVSRRQIPWLMRRTTAPFKRRVFGLMKKTLQGAAPPEGAAA